MAGEETLDLALVASIAGLTYFAFSGTGLFAGVGEAVGAAGEIVGQAGEVASDVVEASKPSIEKTLETGIQTYSDEFQLANRTVETLLIHPVNQFLDQFDKVPAKPDLSNYLYFGNDVVFNLYEDFRSFAGDPPALA